MPLTQLQNVAFGQFRANVTGSSGVGYEVLDQSGNVVTPFTTTGVYQLMTGSGLYAADVTYPDNFNGQIVWTCPSITSSFGTILSASYATEEYNIEPSYALLSGTIASQVQGLYDVAFGRWKIDKTANTMTFYRADNVTVVAIFNLLDDTGAPAFDGVFERQLASGVTP